ncbi:class I SAM-dependent methyltransferase [Pararhodobacter sp.]|uniref:class I SAM-dependent methyltransferase n=1 Tax=Pararhodobacter sp. TaxID=2127056 RepID=UPI002FDEDC88
MSITSDIRFWNKAARRYAGASIGDPAGYERTLARTAAHLRPGDCVLELGCGTGTTALRLAPGVATYLATDISEAMITIAGEKLAQAPVPALSFRVAAAEDLTGAAGTFDAVLGFNYLHLLRDLPESLRSIHALLKPGGLFISKTPCLGDMNPLIGSVLLPVMRFFGKAPHVVPFRAAVLEGMVRGAGFDVLVQESHASKGQRWRPFIVARKP